MMEKELASRLGPLVKSRNFSALKDYVDYRIDFYNKQLQEATDFDSVKFYQGAIKELHRLETLHDEVEGVLTNGR